MIRNSMEHIRQWLGSFHRMLNIGEKDMNIPELSSVGDNLCYTFPHVPPHAWSKQKKKNKIRPYSREERADKSSNGGN